MTKSIKDRIKEEMIMTGLTAIIALHVIAVVCVVMWGLHLMGL
jgi:hypothetical protein